MSVQLTPLAAELAADVLERFLRYVQVATESAHDASEIPSTQKQFDLARILEGELRELGLEDVVLDEHCHVYATLPATVERETPVLGLVAHVDTYPGENGTGVKPGVHRFDGKLALPGDPSQVLSVAEFPDLAKHVGCDLVTSDGTTLLGADDKAGVAEIMGAVAYLARHPEVERGRVKIGFTPDEEIGRGAELFDIEGFGADFAFTADGSGLGEVTSENFNASTVTVTFTGLSAHTGTAKGAMVNSLRLAGEFLARLPKELSPEATESYEGFVHPDRIAGSTAETCITLIARDFDDAGLERHVELVRALAEEVAAETLRAQVRVAVERTYLNMQPYLRDKPWILEAAEQAVRKLGLEPVYKPLRGGTDGAVLTEKGLPTPNLGTGTGQHHSRREWACVQDMGGAAAILVYLAEIVATG